MTSKSNPERLRIQEIEIVDYKGIDHLALSFPTPNAGDPDILVMGSENGLGKTSVLECCALVLQWKTLGPATEISDRLVRAGTQKAAITYTLDKNGSVDQGKLEIYRDGRLAFDGMAFPRPKGDDDSIQATIGFTSNPVLGNEFILLHSYRKVQESNPQMSAIVSRSTEAPRISQTIGEFKVRVLKSILNDAGLFETGTEKESAPIDMLNALISEYAGGVLGKLRASSDNSIDIRISPLNGTDSYSFDGLSSGQKEIISTLFLIWDVSRQSPKVVLIDEPELHLNAQWHRSFIRQLFKLAPQNQYIIATHSQEIMDSVDRSQRILLTR